MGRFDVARARDDWKPVEAFARRRLRAQIENQ